MKAVIMAGGEGTRLRPLTYVMPKPLVSIAGKPIIQITIEQLRRYGFEDIVIATRYRSDMIKTHFRDGSAFGVRVRYTEENKPLGTAGPLTLMRGELDDSFLVVYGDVLTNLDFRHMYHTHLSGKADLTIGVKQHKVEIPYGVIEAVDGILQGIREKPLMQFNINAGIYVLDPSVVDLIPDGTYYDMTDLIARLLKEGATVHTYPINGYWLHLGKTEDLDAANEVWLTENA